MVLVTHMGNCVYKLVFDVARTRLPLTRHGLDSQCRLLNGEKACDVQQMLINKDMVRVLGWLSTAKSRSFIWGEVMRMTVGGVCGSLWIIRLAECPVLCV